MNLTIGCHLEVLLAEMDFKGTGVVTNIEDCPPIAEGRGEVVTGRFVTRRANNLVEVSLSDGTSITGTTTHPIWIPTEKAWVALGHLEPGMYLDSESHDVFVVSLTYKTEPTDVYNIEVYAEHVYRVGESGILVHNIDDDCLEVLKGTVDKVENNVEAIAKTRFIC